MEEELRKYCELECEDKADHPFLEMDFAFEVTDFKFEVRFDAANFQLEAVLAGFEISLGRNLSVDQVRERGNLFGGKAGGLKFEDSCSAHGP